MRDPALDAWGDYDRDHPYPVFACVQTDGPVHEVTLADGHRAWLIVRHEQAKAALNHAGLAKGFAFPLPFTVISELLGVPESDRDHLGSWFTTLLAPAWAPQTPTEAVTAPANIVRNLTGLLARKRAAPGEDLVTDLVRAADQGGALTEQEMLSTIFQLVVAGHDTTTSLIGNGTAALLLHPEQRDALAAAPGPGTARDRGNPAMGRTGPALDVQVHHPGRPLGGTVVPAFPQMIISLGRGHPGPARYANPDKFDITRADTSHLAFGHGIHHCLGARLEGTIALTTLHMRLAVPPSALRWATATDWSCAA